MNTTSQRPRSAVNLPEPAAAKPADLLWTTYLASRAPEACNALIMHYLPLVKFTAGRVYQNRGGQADRDDLIQFGTLGLREAIGHFDPARGVKFETYCARRIHGAMLDGLKASRWIPRDIKQQLARLTDARQRLEAALGHSPDSTLLAEQLGVSGEQLFTLERHQSRASVMPLEHVTQGADDTAVFSHADSLVDQRERQPVDDAQRKDVRDLLLNNLSPVQRMIMMLYYYEDMTMREIGKTLGLSGTRVSQIHSEVVAHLRLRLAHRFPAPGQPLTVNF